MQSGIFFVQKKSPLDNLIQEHVYLTTRYAWQTTNNS